MREISRLKLAGVRTGPTDNQFYLAIDQYFNGLFKTNLNVAKL